MGRAIGAGSVVLVAMMATGAAVAGPLKCAKPDEVTAIQASVIQQQLMVAALTCNDITSFNAFQTGYGVELRNSDMAMEKMFKRLYGTGDGEAAYHAFKTRMANDSSIRSIHDNANYCKEASLVFAAALSPDKPTLAAFVSGIKVTEVSPVDTCDISVANGLEGASAGPFIVPTPNPLRVAAFTPPDSPPTRTAIAAPANPVTATTPLIAAPAANTVTATTPLVAPVQQTQTATAAAAQTAAPASSTPAGALPDVVPDVATNTASATPPEKKSGWLSGAF